MENSRFLKSDGTILPSPFMRCIYHMTFPIVIIKSNESPIYYFDEHAFALVSRGGESFYHKRIIYDSGGLKFLITGIGSVKKAPILTSIKYFQPMYLVDVKYEEKECVTLPELKNIIINHISLYQKYWIKRDLIDNLKRGIIGKNSFIECITCNGCNRFFCTDRYKIY